MPACGPPTGGARHRTAGRHDGRRADRHAPGATAEPCRDSLDGASCIGTGVVYRRSALDTIGGVPTATVTEDLHTSLLLHKAGYEVVYLNEPDLKSFEARKCIARVCAHCDSPAIWIEAQPEVSALTSEAATATDDRISPRRNRTRVKARVLACIRRRGFQEEVAVCEDLSKGGLSFRSRNQYPEGSRLEVAVPYTPGSAAIFVPIRIVFSQAIPAAGLYRHGAAYIKIAVDGGA